MCGPEDDFPQAGRRRMIMPQPIALVGTGQPNPEKELLAQMGHDAVFMMGDNPALPRMPAAPTLADFFHLRFSSIAFRHLIQSAMLAMKAGHSETVIMACLLHDIANGCLIRTDHGYWGAQMIAPYVSEEIAFAVQYHQPLRYFADESVGYHYPESYRHFFGEDFVPADYLKRDADHARQHKWYMTARAVTLFDAYAFDDDVAVSLDPLMDIIGRHFRQPAEGLGFDASPAAHMWRTMIWPNNFL
jgi:hypothetical protein